MNIAQAGIEFNTQKAQEAGDDALADEYKGKAKALNYNLASYTWPGWDEPGFTDIPADILALGLQAAQENLRLAIELKKEEVRVSRAHWAIGAQQIAVKKSDAARKSFQLAVNFAQKAGEAGDETLSLGFIEITTLLANPEDKAAAERLAEVKANLGKLEYADFYIKQLDDSLRIFG
ncbi:MAG: hypothetical protein N2D54_07230 [Chloroflexota bacterium]